MHNVGPRVLVFDSGVGGLSVAACIHRALPGVELVYLADNAGFPYGDKPEQVVIDRCCHLVRKCQQQFACDVIVIACNTASTVRSEERRVGKEGRSRWWPEDEKKKKK